MKRLRTQWHVYNIQLQEKNIIHVPAINGTEEIMHLIFSASMLNRMWAGFSFFRKINETIFELIKFAYTVYELCWYFLIVNHFNTKGNRFSHFRYINVRILRIGFVLSVELDYNHLLMYDLKFLQLRNISMAWNFDIAIWDHLCMDPILYNGFSNQKKTH